MEPILATLLGLHSLAGQRERSSARAIVPGQNLTAALARLFTDAELSQAISALSDAAEAHEHAAALPDLTRLARAVEAHLRANPRLDSQLRTFHDVVATLCAIDSFTRADAPGTLELRLKSAEILRCVRELYIKTDESQPDVILVGMPDVEPIRVDLKGAGYAERRLQIGYSGDQIYPRLYPRTPTSSEIDTRPRERAYWIQKDLPAYDLKIYTHGRRLKGAVRTRSIEWPLTVQGVSLSLHIPALAGARLLATDVSDEHDQVSVRCIRVVQQPGLTA